MDRINELILQLHEFEQRVLNRLPNPHPFIPNGRDNLERNLQQQFYNALESAFLFQFPSMLGCLFTEIHTSILRIRLDIYAEDLTVFDWICTILTVILAVIFVKSIFELKFVGRKKAYQTHFLNNLIVALLELVVLLDMVYCIIFDERLRFLPRQKRFRLVEHFFITLFITLKYLGMFYQNIQIYFRLKEHQQILDTIPQLPYKPNGG